MTSLNFTQLRENECTNYTVFEGNRHLNVSYQTQRATLY